MVFEDFSQELSPYWTQTCLGTGLLSVTNERLRMIVGPIQKGHYADAQLDDYGKLARARFPWRPPLQMEVRARTSHPAASLSNTSEAIPSLQGTAGFGFWNYPFSPRGDIFMLPEAIWFFYASPPSNIALVPDSQGWGWKAQVVHSMRSGAIVAIPPTLASMAWGRLTGQTTTAARWLQRLSGTTEHHISVSMTDWHTYRIEWKNQEVNFWVNDQHLLHVSSPPRRLLGFVTWLDNQYAIVTPQGQFRFGTVTCPEEQWLEIDYIHIQPM